MKYFVRYIPLSREMQEGDIFKRGEEDICTFVAWESEAATPEYPLVSRIRNSRGYEHIYFGQDIKPVKLFLCSRDVKVGDDFYTDDPWWPNETRMTFVQAYLEEHPGNPTLNYKVIGPISSKATYIKEGQEFEEEDIWVYTGGGSSIRTSLTNYMKRNLQWQPNEEYPEVYLPCPTCGALH